MYIVFKTVLLNSYMHNHGGLSFKRLRPRRGDSSVLGISDAAGATFDTDDSGGAAAAAAGDERSGDR